MIEISEEKVKYNVDLVNEKIEELKGSNTSKQNIDSLIENIEGMVTIWNTIGGLRKISKTRYEFEELDISGLATAIETLSSNPISYKKTPTITEIKLLNILKGDKE